MHDIHIERQHHLSLTDARKLAQQWQQSGESDWQLRCDYQRGEHMDTVHFKRSGVSGQLTVSDTHFVLSAQLGFLLKPFSQRISTAIEDNLTQCLQDFS